MKVALVTPWQNAWVPLYEKSVTARGHQFRVVEKIAPSDSDVVLHGWAVGTPSIMRARNIVFLRRYELFEGGLAKVDWSKTNALICVNSWIKNVAEQIFAGENIKTPVHLIYNAVNTDKFTFAERGHGKKIGMACFIHTKKNIPLALQILAALPKGYELHIAGDIQDACLAEYITHLAKAMNVPLHLYGQVPSNRLNEWWDGMNYCLSTSLSEGNPNNVIEAMAKGIKPIVHRWPGAEDQFEAFCTVAEAVKEITEGKYESVRYKQQVQEKYSLANIERVLDIALEEREGISPSDRPARVEGL
jgi:glycosyltransferase involved in cell wall biosynthesis